ncbi:MAG: hypothetical protein AAF517_22690 [Planctomycetota bacterium]
MPHSESQNSKKLFLLVGAALLVAAAVGTSLLYQRTFHDLDTHRDKLGLRDDLVVREFHFQFAPGVDSAMWSRLRAETEHIDRVFDPARVDVTSFSSSDYEFRVRGVDASWWQVDGSKLTGGEVEIDGNFLRVGYFAEGDGTLTVYFYWFEV